MTKFEVDSPVYVNARKGIVVSSDKGIFKVKFENGIVIEYPEVKLIKRHLHCISCNRRLPENSKSVVCSCCMK